MNKVKNISVKEFSQALLSAFADQFHEMKFEEKEFCKLNYSYNAIVPGKGGKFRAVPVVNVDRYYEKYADNDTEIAIQKIIEEYREELKFGESLYREIQMEEYSCCRENLFVRLTNAEKNRKYLADKPHRIIGSMAMTVHIRLTNDESNLLSAVVDNERLCGWEISETTLFEDAIASSAKVNPLEVYPAMEGFDREGHTRSYFFIVTNTSYRDGASAIFYAGVMDSIAEKIGSFYIIPSSVNEVIVTPIGTADEIKKKVYRINREAVAPEDYLSDDVLFYDKIKGEVINLGSYSSSLN